MHRARIVLCALLLNACVLEKAWAAQVCAWIVESVEDGGTHMFKLNLDVDAPTAVSVRFHGLNFISASMGGDMIQLTPGEPKEVDSEGFDVDAGDALHFDVQLYDSPMATLDEMENPTGKQLAVFAFDRKVAETESAPPADLAVRQCKPLG